MVMSDAERREKQRAYSRAWYQANKDRALARHREWKQANPDKVAEQRRRARAEGRETPRFHTMPTNEQVKERKHERALRAQLPNWLDDDDE